LKDGETEVAGTRPAVHRMREPFAGPKPAPALNVHPMVEPVVFPAIPCYKGITPERARDGYPLSRDQEWRSWHRDP
jgi:hypothetical protein